MFTAQKPLIIGHRGASAKFPENTMPAFQHAFEVGKCDMIEFDVRLTRDQIPVILHDESLDRTTNGSGRLNQKTSSDIKAFDAGFYFDPDKKETFPMRGKGITVPTFQEMASELEGKALAIELKESSLVLVDKVVEIVQTLGIEKQIIIGSKHDPVARHLDENFPHLTRFTSRKEILKTCLEFNAKQSPKKERPGIIMSMPPRFGKCDLASKEWIQYVHEKGMKAYYWTIDDPNEMQMLAKHGADAVMTNDPELAQQVLESSKS